MPRAVAPSAGSARQKLYRTSGPGERWWFALLLLPASLTALLVYTSGGSIENKLQHETLVALETAGVAGTTVQVAGRTATVRVPTGQNEQKALAAAETVIGLGGVEVQHVARNAAEERACNELSAKLETLVGARGIGFDGSATGLSRAGAAVVHKVARLLVRCPSAEVTVNGYTDGSVLSGSNVSLRRAEAVRRMLVGDGVKPARIQTRGYGDSFPVSQKDTAAGRTANNRVTITLAGG